jgi:hypothetical protein
MSGWEGGVPLERIEAPGIAAIGRPSAADRDVQGLVGGGSREHSHEHRHTALRAARAIRDGPE